MKTRWIPTLALGLGLVAGGCSQSADIVVPPDTPLVVSVSSTTRSDVAYAGEHLTGWLAEDVRVDGEVVLQAGQAVTLQVLGASTAVHGSTPATLQLGVVAVDLPSGRADVTTEPLEIVGDLGSVEVVVIPAGQRLSFSTTTELGIPRS